MQAVDRTDTIHLNGNVRLSEWSWYNCDIMSAQHHYVSKFHLRQFLDPDSLSQRDPWLWQGRIADGVVKRRAPKNVGTKSLLFDGPGGLADRNATLESFLANEVEGPAAAAIREVCRQPYGSGFEMPPALMRYLGWAAARNLPMQQLFSDWARAGWTNPDQMLVEPPPEGLLGAIDSKRAIAMTHSTFGARVFPWDANLTVLAKEGWILDYNDSAGFLESVHIQAYYFQVRFFPRFHWFALHAPDGEFFVIADRAVGWAADGYIDAPPSCLRHPSAFVLAPLSRSLVIVGRHTTDSWNVTPSQVNALIALWAQEWIAGPTQFTVEAALDARRRASSV